MNSASLSKPTERRVSHRASDVRVERSKAFFDDLDAVKGGTEFGTSVVLLDLLFERGLTPLFERVPELQSGSGPWVLVLAVEEGSSLAI